MKKLLTIILLIAASQSFAQNKLVGAYYVNNNPKNIVRIIYDARNDEYAVVSSTWEGKIEAYEETKKAFTVHWRYPFSTKDAKLRGLEGEHVCVIGAKGIINVQVIPDDDEMAAGTLKWYPAKK